MNSRKHLPRWKIILRAWPPAGAIFVILSFAVTGFWLWHALVQAPGELGWLEPLAAFLAGTGAFILAAIVIFRRVDSARSEASEYGLARGLATGYYFNFVRPLVRVISDPDHPLHTEIAAPGGHRLSGVVVGLPRTVDEFDPKSHAETLDALGATGSGFDIREVAVPLPGRPRPLHTRVAFSQTSDDAIFVDIPTTLTVIADFARFFADQELGDAPAGDEKVAEARTEIVAADQSARFQDVLDEFIDVVTRVGAKESRRRSPAAVLHVVPVHRLRHRLRELAAI